MSIHYREFLLTKDLAFASHSQTKLNVIELNLTSLRLHSTLWKRAKKTTRMAIAMQSANFIYYEASTISTVGGY